MKNKIFSKAYASLFQNIGTPTLRSTAELRAMQQECIGRNDPNTFYATVDSRPDPKVVWSCSTETHFGSKEFTHQGFFEAIHPFWLPLYIGMAELTYCIVSETVSDNRIRDLSLTTNLPLRNKSGQYYWYSQMSIAGSFDDRGALVEYFNEFHRLAEFDRLVPTKPALTFRGNRLEFYDTQLRKELNGLLDKSLRKLLSPTSFKSLQAYRVLKPASCPISRKDVALYLGVGLPALDKGNLRLLDQASSAFPAATLTSVADLADFLNERFGRPQDHKCAIRA
jgi:hypothetical protein